MGAVPASAVGVAIVDDDRDFAESLAALLRLDPGIDIVGIATTVCAGCALVNSPQVRVALIDVNMPDGGGLSVFDRVAVNADAPVMVLISARRRSIELAQRELRVVPKHELSAEVVHLAMAERWGDE